MIKIPQNSKWSQPNNSDLFDNIYYTKSVNFDETGYLKLSSRAVSVISEQDDSNFDIPVSYGRYTTGGFAIATFDNPYLLDVSNTSFSMTQDTDSGGGSPPSLSVQTYGKWWRNRWHVTTDTKLYYKTISNGDWTDTSISALTSGVSHPLEAFDSQSTLVVGNGNIVRQYDSSYATTNLAQLTLSTDYEVIGLSYNNNLLGIATRLSNTIEGQNKEAMFFTWDGNASSANAGYGVGSDSVLAIVPYKSSFLILNRIGQLLYFNGGGFELLASFPVYFQDVIWGDFLNKLSFGDSIIVRGNLIYINIKNTVTTEECGTNLENMIGGIWCYDPAVGLYHKYSPSISKANLITVLQAGVNTTTNLLTANAGTIVTTGNPVKILQSFITPISAGTIYYMIKVSSTTFYLASTKDLAMALTPIDLTAVASGTNYLLALETKDYGQNRVSRSGGAALMGSKTFSYDKIIFGGDYYDTGTAFAHMNLSVFGFKNIGYFVTAKINSPYIEDNIVQLTIKYRPLVLDDKIKIKYKNKDFNNIPSFASCTVTSNTVLTTTTDITDAYAYSDELECEFIGGKGAGQMSKVSSITLNAGTYTITLLEEIEGITNGDIITVKLDNWTELQTITRTNTKNWLEVPIAKTSKWTKFKVVLEGSDTTIEELQINNTKQLPAN